MRSIRSEFLERFWSRYPALPQGAKAFGRIVEITQSSLVLNGILKPFDTSHLILVSNTAEKLEMEKILKPNDWIAITASSVVLLAPAYEEPLKLSSSPEIQLKWNLFLQTVREFFYARKFLEITTPSLVTCPGTEPFLDYFTTEFVQGSRTRKFYLPTSPELHLKKVLAGGYEQVFEIKSCFRNGEISPTHQPEFLMLEWYRAGRNLEDIKSDVVELVRVCAERLKVSVESPGTVSMRDLFQKYLGFGLSPETTQQELVSLARSKGLSVKEDEIWDDVFFRLYVEFIEPFLKDSMFVEKYPPSQAALARLTEDGWGDRFEFYLGGMEIANAFHELNDPEIQLLRFEEDLAKKLQLQKETPPLDEDFLHALLSGMPPSAGIALGLERLFMALTGEKNISQLRLFPMNF